MRRVVYVLGSVGIASALLIVAGFAYVARAYPNVKTPVIVVPETAEAADRGRYLVEHVAACARCHAVRDWSVYGAPPLPDTHLAGGGEFGEDDGVRGRVVAGNLTPKALGDWSDGEVARALVAGVDRDGTALHPVASRYPYYANLCREDLAAILAYLRSLPPKPSPVGSGDPPGLRFPESILFNLIPRDYGAPDCPDADDLPARGEYLAVLGGCLDCHTPGVADVPGSRPDPTRRLAGGRVFRTPDGLARSANITRHPETGLGDWDEARFVGAFAEFRDALPEREGQTPMPWSAYAGMTDADLRALWTYLDRQPVVRNDVSAWTPD